MFRLSILDNLTLLVVLLVVLFVLFVLVILLLLLFAIFILLDCNFSSNLSFSFSNLRQRFSNSLIFNLNSYFSVICSLVCSFVFILLLIIVLIGVHFFCV